MLINFGSEMLTVIIILCSYTNHLPATLAYEPVRAYPLLDPGRPTRTHSRARILRWSGLFCSQISIPGFVAPAPTTSCPSHTSLSVPELLKAPAFPTTPSIHRLHMSTCTILWTAILSHLVGTSFCCFYMSFDPLGMFSGWNGQAEWPRSRGTTNDFSQSPSKSQHGLY